MNAAAPLRLPVVAFLSQWNGARIPFAAADEQSEVNAGDWDIDGPRPADKIAEVVAVVRARLARGTKPGQPAPRWAMLDYEEDTWHRQNYAQVLAALHAAFPAVTFGVWTPGMWWNPVRPLYTLLKNGDGVMMPMGYQRKIETPAEAQADMAHVLAECRYYAPEVPFVPCLGAGVGFEHPRYPPYTNSVEPLCSVANLTARLETLWALREEYPAMKGVCIWGGAVTGDLPRVAAITALGALLKPVVARLRGGEIGYAGGAAASA